MKRHINILPFGKAWLGFFAMLCPLSMFADDVTPGITVNRTDGSSISVAINELQSIKFAEGNMIVKMNDNSQQTFIIDDITNITFNDITTAIKALTSSSLTGESKVTITDLSGRTVYNGTAEQSPAQGQLPAGIYIITANGKSCKLMIK